MVTLEDARAMVTDLVRTDTETIRNNTVLAERLRGISEAIGVIVLSQENLEAGGLLRHFAPNGPASELLFTAKADNGNGAHLALYIVTQGTTQIRHNFRAEADIPSDAFLDELLSMEPSARTNSSVRAKERDGGRTRLWSPFHYGFQKAAAPGYFGIVRDLASELLRRTS